MQEPQPLFAIKIEPFICKNKRFGKSGENWVNKITFYAKSFLHSFQFYYIQNWSQVFDFSAIDHCIKTKF